jgi:hypothetical protein
MLKREGGGKMSGRNEEHEDMEERERYLSKGETESVKVG